jgi:aromatic ring hydroxylase
MPFSFTSTEFVERLRDGRSVYLGGEVVRDIPSHAAFSGIVDSLCMLIEHHRAPNAPYMMQRCAETARNYSSAYMIPRDLHDVELRGKAFRSVASLTGGVMARTPDFLAAILASWASAQAFFVTEWPELANNVQDYYRYCREQHICLAHAISDPPADRYGASKDGSRLSLRKEEETSDGIIVSGMKMLATLAPVADELLVYPFRPLSEDEENETLAFAIPIATPGLKLLCRPSMSEGGSRCDAPLSSRFDEMDAICVFERVLVPWHRVFINGRASAANSLRAKTGMTRYAWHQVANRTEMKIQLILGVASLFAKLSGRISKADVKADLGQLSAMAEAISSLRATAEATASIDSFGAFAPASSPLGALTVLAPQFLTRATEILRTMGGSSIVMCANQEDVIGEMGDIYKKYQTAGDDAVNLLEVMKLMVDLTHTKFGSRQLLYESSYLGDAKNVSSAFYNGYMNSAASEKLGLSLIVPLTSVARSI